jgi:molecular chaperone DnaK (HSP70)
MPKFSIRLSAAVLAITIVVAGCGGGGGDGDANEEASAAAKAPAPTKAEFIKIADSVCEQTDKQQDKLLREFKKNHPKAESSKAGLEEIVIAGLPSIEAEGEGLRELRTPEGDEAEIKAMIAEIESALAKAEKDPSTMLGNTPGPFTSVSKRATKYGFDACAFPL